MDDHQLSFWFGNIASAGAIVSTMAGWLPPVTALVALLYYFIQISESPTVRVWRLRRRLRKIARLKAELVMLEALPSLEPAMLEDKED